MAIQDSKLSVFLSPKSIAVVGASSRETSVGHAIFRNLVTGPQAFEGPVYAVNPKGGGILGHPTHRSLAEIGETVDLVVVAIPPRFIPGLMTEAGAVGARGAVVISAGFSELGDDGRELQQRMVRAARDAGIRVLGPNCLGVIRPDSRMNASFSATTPRPGRIGLISQSGALITGLLSYADMEHFGLSAAISTGGKADLADDELVELLGSDDATSVIALYIEELPDPLAFFEVAERVSVHKPIVVIKGGATEAGARAASSHTGSIAGALAAYRAGFAQAGVLQADSISEFMAWARALAYQPAAAGKRIAIVTNAGGPGVLSADEAGRRGLELATLSDETIARLNEVLPPVWSHNNPVDIIGDATPERYRDAINIIGAAPEVDGVVVIMTVQAMTDPLSTAEAIAQAHTTSSWTKPLVSSFLGQLGTEAGSFLDERGVPEFNTPEVAVGAMAALVARGAPRRMSKGTQAAMPRPHLERAREVFDKAVAAGQTNLDLALATEVLASAGIRYNRSASVKDAAEAANMAEDIGFPVVIKLVSPDIVHKSDVGGVVLGVGSRSEVADACASIQSQVAGKYPNACITGFTVEEQVSGTEIIVGMSRDAKFGPLMMVGMGGVFVEVYKDVAFRLAPLSHTDALAMIAEIRAQPLLDGARARPVLDREELAEVLVRISRLVEHIPDIAELDLNPLVITDSGLVAIDARVMTAGAKAAH